MMPHFEDLIDHLLGFEVFLKSDLLNEYHKIRILLNDEWKTAFKTSEELFKWKVMSFGQCNVPSTFMRLMMEVFKLFLNSFFVIYFDGILVYIASLEKHLVHLHHIFGSAMD